MTLTIHAPSTEGTMVNGEPLSRLQLPDDRRSDSVWVLLLSLGLFVIGIGWLDWMF